MSRRPALALAVGLLAAAACRLDAPGACATAADCDAGLTCQAGVCQGCDGDASCGAWQACGATHRCEARAGACDGDAGCEGWEACGADHACALRPGACGTAADCGAWEDCAGHRCAPQAGRCSAAGDCPFWQACVPASHTCGRPTFDGAAVHLWGTLDAAACGFGAVAPIDHPEQARVGFDCAPAPAAAAILPDGDLAYTAGAAPTRSVRRLEPDAMAFSAGAGRWLYPAAPSANDPVLLPAFTCPAADLDHWIVQGGTGAVLGGCATAAGFDYRDATGAVVFSGDRILAWTAGGLRLTRGAAGYRLVDGAGAASAVAGLGAGVDAVAARASGEAIWVVDGAGFGAPRRYTVRAPGVATFDGAVAALPAGVAAAAASGEAVVIDGAGALIQLGARGGKAVVVARPLAPAAAVIAYDEAALPAGSNAFTAAAAFRPWVLPGDGALVTGR